MNDRISLPRRGENRFTAASFSSSSPSRRSSAPPWCSSCAEPAPQPQVLRPSLQRCGASAVLPVGAGVRPAGNASGYRWDLTRWPCRNGSNRTRRGSPRPGDEPVLPRAQLLAHREGGARRRAGGRRRVLRRAGERPARGAAADPHRRLGLRRPHPPAPRRRRGGLAAARTAAAAPRRGAAGARGADPGLERRHRARARRGAAADLRRRLAGPPAHRAEARRPPPVSTPPTRRSSASTTGSVRVLGRDGPDGRALGHPGHRPVDPCATIPTASPTRRSTTSRWRSTATPPGRSATSPAPAGPTRPARRCGAVRQRPALARGRGAGDDRGLEVAVARTMPAYRGRPRSREAAALTADMLAAAARSDLHRGAVPHRPLRRRRAPAPARSADGPDIVIVLTRRSPT